jgi:PAS domain S-box-containing protein
VGDYSEGVFQAGRLPFIILPGFLAAAALLLFFFYRLDERTAELADGMQRYRLLFDTSPAGIVVIARGGILKEWNSAFRNMLGYTDEALAQMSPRELTHPEDRAMGKRLDEQLRADPETSITLEKRYLRADGEIMWGRSRLSALNYDDNGILEYFGVVEDITLERQAQQAIRQSRDKLEREVERRTAQLQASNAELTAFSYSISHDLRAPLRGIDGFSAALMEDYGEGLDAEARFFIARIRAGTKRMGTLIDDLLELSRLGRRALVLQPVNLADLAAPLLEELRSGDPDRTVTFRAHKNLGAQCDPTLMGIVLQNLLGNAWKFTRGTEHPQIELGRNIDEDGRPHFFVRDNGVGFDMAHVDQLFVPFQRLHHGDEFPGNGIGLATVQRVIRRHGGLVWAEGKEGEGATFWFTLFESDPNPQESPEDGKS